MGGADGQASWPPASPVCTRRGRGVAEHAQTSGNANKSRGTRDRPARLVQRSPSVSPGSGRADRTGASSERVSSSSIAAICGSTYSSDRRLDAQPVMQQDRAHLAADHVGVVVGEADLLPQRGLRLVGQRRKVGDVGIHLVCESRDREQERERRVPGRGRAAAPRTRGRDPRRVDSCARGCVRPAGRVRPGASAGFAPCTRRPRGRRSS